MKTNIQKTNLDGKPTDKGKWWKWQEYCDRCGESCLSEQFLHSREPDTTEEDLCRKCLRELLEARHK